MSLSSTSFIDLPEECLSQILSLTTPTDVIRSSAVSKQFLAASESDLAWEKFIPLNCDHFIDDQSFTQLVHDQRQQQEQIVSKKELYFRLCRSPILLNNDCSKTGKKSYRLGARALNIAWGGTHQHWKYVPRSRSLEIVELYTDYDECRLEIKGRIHTKFLSPDTTYAVYFVFKTDADDNHAYRFEHIPVRDGNGSDSDWVELHPHPSITLIAPSISIHHPLHPSSISVRPSSADETGGADD